MRRLVFTVFDSPRRRRILPFFSSLEQCSGRAIVLPLASALANVNGHMIDLIYSLYANRYWAKIICSSIGLGLEFIKLNFWLNFLSFPNQMMNLNHILYDDR